MARKQQKQNKEIQIGTIPLLNYTTTFSGKLDDVLNEINDRIVSVAAGKGITDRASIDVEFTSNWGDDYEIVITARREETDEEFAARIKRNEQKAKKARELRAAQKKAREAQERVEYERLKAKFQ
jgi:HD-like signal output (HDOD) protein